jgi:hypothetical protein
MAEKSDDIKNLFMNLGLNPSDYHEIRSAPTANATVSEAPRRWSLLQAAQPLRNLNIPAAPAAPVAAPAPVAMPAFAEPATLAPPTVVPVAAAAAMPPLMASALPSALLAAAEDIARAEVSRGAPPSRARAPEQPPTVEPVQSALPSSLSAAFAEPLPADGLQSLFQSVKEPQTASINPLDAPRYTERRTDQLHHTPPTSSPAARAAAMSALADAEPETRYAAPPASRLGPLPTAVASAPPRAETAPAAAPAAPVKLRFGAAPAEPAAANGESLQDVFRRLSRENRG